MNKVDHFMRASERIRSLDHQGYPASSEPMLAAYKARNSFGLNPGTKLHRIFQRDYLEADVSSGTLTLPRASATFWKDPLENPLSGVSGVDDLTKQQIDYGSVVRSYYALCWTHRLRPRESDWQSFSHGKPAIRISTSAIKLLDRTMDSTDPAYMHRVWLPEVDYKHPDHIKDMKTDQEVVDRLESTGASLVLSAATVQSGYIDEDEVRLLYDAGVGSLPHGATRLRNDDLVQIPFDWTDFIEASEDRP